MLWSNIRSIFFVATGLVLSQSAQAQTYYGSPQAAPQAPPPTSACYPTGCYSTCFNIPTGTVVVPNPNPNEPGGSPNNCIEIWNGCPTPDKTYKVTHYYYKYYKIVNKPVPYDKIEYEQKPLHKICSAENPCPPCVAAGGYGKADHAGTLSSPEEVEAMNRATASNDAAPAAPPAPAPAAAPAPTAAPVPAAPAAPVVSSTPKKQWIWLTNSNAYGYGYINASGYAVVDPGTMTATPPTTAAPTPTPTTTPSLATTAGR